jgi:hypothetical protein
VSGDFYIVRAMPAKRVAKAKATPARKSAPAKAKSTNGRGSGKGAVKVARGRSADVAAADPSLFAPLTPGEVADALRTLTEDRRVASMAKVGRYRVVAAEPLVVKPPNFLAGHRLARVVIYDYSNDRAVDACVDLDKSEVAHLEVNKSQPMLSREEEAIAISVAVTDDRVREKLSLGDEPLSAMHYWGKDPSDLAYARRSAAVIFGRQGGHPSLVAVVDLLDNLVTSVVPASQW